MIEIKIIKRFRVYKINICISGRGKDMSESMPGIVYHYCTLDTFEKIVTNGTLKLTDITQSNDGNELVFYANNYERLRDYFIQLEKKDEKLGYLKKCLDMVYGYINNIVCYTSCFSKLIDSLGQWRGYGDDGKGIAIGFDTEKLTEFENYKFFFDKVEYNKLPKETDVAEMINVVKDKDALSNFLMKSMFTKYRGYSDEKEYRLLFMRVKSRDLNIEKGLVFDDKIQYDKKDVKKEYLLLKINVADLIKKIYIGPSCCVDEQYIRGLLNNKKIIVKKSQLSYRSRS